MPRCENFGPWTSVEGKMCMESSYRGHVIMLKLAGENVIVKSFPTYDEARQYAKEKYDSYVSEILGRDVELSKTE